MTRDMLQRESPRALRTCRWFARAAVVLLLAVGLYTFYRSYVERAAAAELSACGGYVATRSTIPTWLQKLCGDDLAFFSRVHFVGIGSSRWGNDRGLKRISEEMPHIEGLNALNGDITDHGLRSLKEMRSLRSLGLSGTQVTDAGLEHLSRLTSLQRLRLGNTQITDAGLVHLTSLAQLERLSLGNTRITDEGIKLLAGMTHLRELCLAGTQVTEVGVEWLQRALPQCKIDVVNLTL